MFKKLLAICALSLAFQATAYADEGDIVYYDDYNLDEVTLNKDVNDPAKDDLNKDKKSFEDEEKKDNKTFDDEKNKGKKAFNDEDDIVNRPEEITEIENEIIMQKGFVYDGMKDGFRDLYTHYSEPLLEDEEMLAVNKWAKDVAKKSGAIKQKTDLGKAKYAAAFIKSNYPYGAIDESVGNDSAVGALYKHGRATCGGFSYAFIRVLDVMGIESYKANSRKDGVSHAVTRAYLDGKWKTLEPTGYEKSYDLHKDLISGRDIDNFIIIPAKAINYVYSNDELWDNNYRTKYVVHIDKDIEDYLSKNNFKIYGY